MQIPYPAVSHRKDRAFSGCSATLNAICPNCVSAQFNLRDDGRDVLAEAREIAASAPWHEACHRPRRDDSPHLTSGQVAVREHRQFRDMRKPRRAEDQSGADHASAPAVFASWKNARAAAAHDVTIARRAPPATPNVRDRASSKRDFVHRVRGSHAHSRARRAGLRRGVDCGSRGRRAIPRAAGEPARARRVRSA